MRLELQIGGKCITIEAEGAVSVHVRDEITPASSTVVAPASDPVVAAIAAPVAATAVAPEATPDSVPGTSAQVAQPSRNDALFTRLSELRKEIAIAANVPPYVIFHDKALRVMAELMPQDLEEFAKIGGVGNAKLEKYGEIFLDVIRAA